MVRRPPRRMDPCEGTVRRFHRTADRGHRVVRPRGARPASAGLHLPDRPRHAFLARQVALQDLYRGLHCAEGQEIGFRGILFPHRTLLRLAGVLQPAFGGRRVHRADGAAVDPRGGARQRRADRGGDPEGQRVPAVQRQQAQAGPDGIPGRQPLCRDAEAEGFLPRTAHRRGVPARTRPAGTHRRAVPPHAAVHRHSEPGDRGRSKKRPSSMPCGMPTRCGWTVMRSSRPTAGRNPA